MPPFLSRLVCLFTLAVFAGASPLPAEPATANGNGGELVYGQAGGHDLRLDLYLPDAAPPRGKKWPVVLFLHGGGWRFGSKAEGKGLAALFTQKGIAFASADYRLDTEALWPAQIHDAKTAVRYLRANTRLGLDPARIGVCGTSAGGHLAALLGTTPGVAALEDRSEGSPGVSTRVRAVCSVSGPVDLGIQPTTLVGRFFVRHELGGSAQEKPDLVRQADPSLYVRGGEPPFLLIYGERDHLVLPEHARRMAAALRAHGGDVTVDLVPGGKHVPLGGEKQRAEIVAFFQKHLAARRP